MPEKEPENTQSEIVGQLPYAELGQAIQDNDHAKIIELVNDFMFSAKKSPGIITEDAVQYLRNIRIHAWLVGADNDHWRQIKRCFNKLR